MDILIIVGMVIGIVFIIAHNYIKNAEQQAKEAAKEREKKRAARKAEEEQEKNEFAEFLENNKKEYGTLTKEIIISRKKAQNILVFEETQTILILGKKYHFKDILTSKIEKVLYKKGETEYTTIPDKYQMAEEQVLWGMGKKYNVKTRTQTRTKPDIYKYHLYIGINNISQPQISFVVWGESTANEINNLMQVIIQSNKTQQ